MLQNMYKDSPATNLLINSILVAILWSRRGGGSKSISIYDLYESSPRSLFLIGNTLARVQRAVLCRLDCSSRGNKINFNYN